ncbi:uncharacterized protein LOC116349566 [Contarinia nasturtii]|uniref:uncharacterized protein LOC116349566 n=1 Tax=Contarinia nasturtii TaxID=265458 RepID=UPI0012D43ACD|nr:uncharacterized protein LOC116349566 [Contarinia nasturtii]
MAVFSTQKDKNIGIFGLDKAGMKCYEALYNIANIICFDENPSIRESFAEKYGIDKLLDITDSKWKTLDKIVLSPDNLKIIPSTHDIFELSNSAGIPIISDIDLFYDEIITDINKTVNFVAVTGTNGKSSTTSLIAQILKQNKRNCLIGGMGAHHVSTLDLTADDYILEISSSQLELLKSFKPKIAILLNISNDHLDKYETIENYTAVQYKIFDRMDKDCYAIINIDNEITKMLYDRLMDEDKTNLIPIHAAKLLKNGVSIHENNIHDNLEREGVESNKFLIPKNQHLQGVHNHENILAAYAACCVLGHLEPENIMAAIKEFEGLPHTLQFIDTIEHSETEIQFYNDSKATNVAAACSSLATFDNIYWLAGGIAKQPTIGENEFEAFHSKIRKAYLFGKDKQILGGALKGKVNLSIYDNLNEAFNAAVVDAKNDSTKLKTILLAPACAAQDQFKNSEDRGDFFIKLCTDCKLNFEFYI